MANGAIEIISRCERRRRWSLEENPVKRVSDLLPWNVGGIRPRLDQRKAAWPDVVETVKPYHAAG
jgi:hypothetical protein